MVLVCIHFICGLFFLCALGNLCIKIKHCFQGILHDTNGKMPVLLQDRSKLCLLGQFASDVGSRNAKLFEVGTEEDDQCESSSCGCHKLSGSLEQCRQIFVGNSYWIQMLCDRREQFGKDITWIPKLHHIHWNGEIVSRCDVHVCKS